MEVHVGVVVQVWRHNRTLILIKFLIFLIVHVGKNVNEKKIYGRNSGVYQI